MNKFLYEKREASRFVYNGRVNSGYASGGSYVYFYEVIRKPMPCPCCKHQQPCVTLAEFPKTDAGSLNADEYVELLNVKYNKDNYG